MASLDSLPTELVLLILGELDYSSEVNAVAQTCHRLHHVASDYLYSHYAETYSPQGVNKIIEKGNIDALNKLLLAGVEFDNHYYLQASPRTTPLRLAASKGQLHIINLLSNFFGESTLIDHAYEVAKDAAENGHAAILGDLLWMEVYLDIPDETNLRTILSLVAEKGQLECVEVLVNAGCNLDTWDVRRQTPLWFACKEGHLDVVKFLVEAGADPEITANEAPFPAPIYCAALEGHRDIVKYLLEKKAHPNLSPTANVRVLSRLVIKELRRKGLILPLLVDPASIEAEVGWCTDTTRWRLLTYAVACGYCDLVDRISSMSYEVELDSEYCSTLQIAAYHGFADIVSVLIAKSGEMGTDEWNVACERALTAGVVAGHQKVVDMVLGWSCNNFVKTLDADAVRDAMANPALMDWILERKVLRNFDDDEDGAADSIIRAAMSAGNVKALGRILQWRRRRQWDSIGALEREYIGVRKYNLIEAAAVFGRADVFKFILNKPWKQPKPAEKKWRSVLYFAAKHKSVEIVRIFLNSGFDVHDSYGENPRDPGQPLLLSFVDRRGLVRKVENIEERQMEGVRFLVDRGANVNVTDTNGWTALGLATRQHDMDMVKELLRLGADPFACGHFTTSAFYVAFADNSSSMSLELVEMYLEEGQRIGRYPEFEEMFALGSGEDDDETGAEWDPEPAQHGLSELGWLRFQKMKRVRTLYWRLQYPAPGFTPKW